MSEIVHCPSGLADRRLAKVEEVEGQSNGAVTREPDGHTGTRRPRGGERPRYSVDGPAGRCDLAISSSRPVRDGVNGLRTQL